LTVSAETLKSIYLPAPFNSSQRCVTLLKILHLIKKYGRLNAVNDLSLDVEKGDIVALLGPSGCGKTTTLRCVAGLEKPDDGEIIINGKTVFSRNVFVPPEKRNVGMVFQSYALWPHMNVFDNVAYPLKLRRYARPEIRKQVLKALELVGLSGMEYKFPSQLSGGQQQRVALARAIVYEPQLILLDEPLSNLDAKLRERVRGELKYLLKKIGLTALYVTHDQEEAFVIADRIVLMDAGRIVQVGTPMEIYEKPANKFVAEFIGRANVFEATVVERGGEDGYGFVKLKKGGDVVLYCKTPNSVPNDCIAFIRPNEIYIYDKLPAERFNVIEGRVVFTEFRGQYRDIRVEIEGGNEIIVSTHRFCASSTVQLPDIGMRVYIYIPPEAITLVNPG